MMGYEEKVERIELIGAVSDAGRLARDLDQLLESLTHADQLDPLDVEERAGDTPAKTEERNPSWKLFFDSCRRAFSSRPPLHRAWKSAVPLFPVPRRTAAL